MDNENIESITFVQPDNIGAEEFVVDVSSDESDEFIEIESDSDESDVLFSDELEQPDDIVRPPNPVPQADMSLDGSNDAPSLPTLPSSVILSHLVDASSRLLSNSDTRNVAPIANLFNIGNPSSVSTTVNQNVTQLSTSNIVSLGSTVTVSVDNDVLLSTSTSDSAVVTLSRTTPISVAITSAPLVPMLTPVPIPMPFVSHTPHRPVITSLVRSPPAPTREIRVLLDQNQSIEEFRSPKRRKLMSPDNVKIEVKNESDDDGDTCPICFEFWTTSGIHRLISLRCGHLFGQSCIIKWLKGQGGKCPQCNAKAKRQDIRVLYTKGIRAVDTTERDRALQELAKERETKRKMELEGAQLRLKYHQSIEECSSLRSEQERLRRELALLRTQSSSNNSISQSQPSTSIPILQKAYSSIFVQERTINISESGKCRVLTFSSSLAALLVSQPSQHQLFKGFGVKKISTLDFKTFQYLTIHSKAIRDICFHPFEDDGMLLSCAMDKSVKLTSMDNNAVVQTYETPMPVWSCVWNSTNKSYFYAGLQNGTVLEYDTRNTAEAVQEINKDGISPVVSLQYISKDETASFKQEGLLVGQLNSTSFYEKKTNNAMKLHLLPLEGNLTSLCFDNNTRQLLASFRPSTKFPFVRHQVCRMVSCGNFGGSQSLDDICTSTLIHTLKGSRTQTVLSRSTLFPTGDDSDRLIVCGSDESTSMIHTWDSIDGKQLQRVSCGGVPVAMTPMNVNNNKYLAALTEQHVRVFKWQ